MNITCAIETKVKGTFLCDKPLCMRVYGEKERDTFHYYSVKHKTSVPLAFRKCQRVDLSQLHFPPHANLTHFLKYAHIDTKTVH